MYHCPECGRMVLAGVHHPNYGSEEVEPKFLTTLSVSPYPDGRTWFLNRPLVYRSARLGTIVVPEGFETDYASVPVALTNVLPRWGDYGLASVLHDWMYWNQSEDRATADSTFLGAMTVLGVSNWKKWTLYSAVRTFGGAVWNDNVRIAGEGYSRVKGTQSPGTPAWRRRIDLGAMEWPNQSSRL